MKGGNKRGGLIHGGRRLTLLLLADLLAALLVLASCRSHPAPAMPTVAPTPTLDAFPTLTPRPAQGGAFWPQSPCAACHGLTAAGIAGNGPTLRGQKLDPSWAWEMVRGGFRYGGALPHPMFGPAVLSDRQIIDMVAWLNEQPPAR